MVVPENTGVYINDFMFDLNLKGFELLAYALIYSYSANGNKQGYYGSCETMAKRLHTTRQRINIVLNSLAEKKLVIKHEVFVNKMKMCVYQTNYNYEKPQGVIETMTGCHRNDDRGVIETMHNNILDNINNNINFNSSEPNGSSEFANETAEVDTDTSSSPIVTEESHKQTKVTDTESRTSDSAEKNKVVPARGEAELWDGLPDIESPKTKSEKKPRTYYKAPTISEISQYIGENNFLVDAQTFYRFYSDRNWMVGKSKIDWKGKVRQWDLDRRSRNQNFGKSKGRASPDQLDSNTDYSVGVW